MTTTTTHLNFRGDARAALEFYGAAFGAAPTVISYADAHDEGSASNPQHVIWGLVANEAGVRVMAYDVQQALDYAQGVNSVYVSVSAETEDEVRGYWEGLLEGAEVEVPIGPSFWSPVYGKLRDRFGVVWVLDLATER